MKIWCLFSVENLYDQPDYNLVAFFSKSPTLDDLSEALFNSKLEKLSDDRILNIVGIKKGENTKVDGTDYRLQEVTEKERLK